MKRFLLATITLIFLSSTVGFADIQSPPGDKFNRARKLSRGMANIIYGVTEMPQTMQRYTRAEGPGALVPGMVDGTKRSVVRLGFGVYEFLTFPVKSYKGGFLPPGKKIWWDLNNGYTDLPPEIGMKSNFPYTRVQKW
ncbi:MAG: exosortase system-associated protein, TIGR04073 family [Verrucomicrobiota bacterium]